MILIKKEQNIEIKRNQKEKCVLKKNFIIAKNIL